jgi:hypothetical protein
LQKEYISYKEQEEKLAQEAEELEKLYQSKITELLIITKVVSLQN